MTTEALRNEWYTFAEMTRLFRAGVLFAYATFLVIASLVAVAQSSFEKTEHDQQIKVEEHRFTAIETRLDAQNISIAEMKADIKDLRSEGWMLIIGIVGLCGEAGIRLVKKKVE